MQPEACRAWTTASTPPPCSRLPPSFALQRAPRLSLSFHDEWPTDEYAEDPAARNTEGQMLHAIGLLPQEVQRRVRLAEFDCEKALTVVEEAFDGVSAED